MIGNIILAVIFFLVGAFTLYNGIQMIRDLCSDEDFGKFLIILAVMCFVIGGLTAYGTADVYLSQGTYEYKSGTYTVYIDGSYKKYDVDVVTDKVKDTGLTKDEFEQLLKDKDFTEKE